MVRLRNAVIVMMLICIGLQLVACNSLALSGDKRYKTEINNVLLNCNEDFSKNGEVSDATVAKMDKMVTKYQADYGEKGSFIRFKEMIELVKKAKADSANAFNLMQQAMMKKSEVEGYLTTEVKD
jgi:hypothetical protein